MTKEEYKLAKQYVNMIKNAENMEEGEKFLEKIYEMLEEKRTPMANKFLKEKEDYLSFLSFPSLS